MNRLSFAASTVASIFVATVVSAATPVDGVKTALIEARTHLLALLDAPDAPAQAKHEAEVVKATKSVDTQLTASLGNKTATPAEIAKLKEFKATWEEFKKTRDGQIIPFVKAGKKDDARALAKGVQAERFKKMSELLVALGAK